MTSSTIESPIPLKSKLSQVRYTLDEAHKRLQEDYEIFTIKTSSASSSSGGVGANLPKQNGANKDVSIDLIRTMSDVSTIRSVLSCPIFNRIVNVVDSLDKISYHSNLHPSIGPSDINIDANGELILAPPIEPSAFNNLINAGLDEMSDHSNMSPHIISPNFGLSNNETYLNNELQRQIARSQVSYDRSVDSNGSKHETPMHANLDQHMKSCINSNATKFDTDFSIESAGMKPYATEKLVSNGDLKHRTNGNYQRNQNAGLVGNPASNEGRRLYKANGNYTLDQTTDSNSKFDSGRAQSVDQITDQSYSGQRVGYSNETYNTTHELNQRSGVTMHEDRAQSDVQSRPYRSQGVNSANVGKISSVQNTGVQYNRGSCSPSTSVGSTVRLADECDSGASSYESQANKSIPCSVPNPPQRSHQEENKSENPAEINSGSKEQLIAPEIEHIKVTLEKDNDSLGITIAGYSVDQKPTCGKEISGIFIKAITPGSPADRSGKVRTFDQILAVDGRELLDYSNQEGFEVLRRTGKVVTLDLIRRSTESSDRKLENTLARVAPPRNSADSQASKHFREETSTPNMIVSSPTPLVLQSSYTAIERANIVQVSHDTSGSGNKSNQEEDSIYRNSSVLQGINNEPYSGKQFSGQFEGVNIPSSHGQTAAPRNTANKVIETKQGARNTVDIRSPACQAIPSSRASETKIKDSPKNSIATRLQLELGEDFGDFTKLNVPEWESEVRIVSLTKEGSQGLGFRFKIYASRKDRNQSFIVISEITPGGIVDMSGELALGDQLIFVDATDLVGASQEETERALKKTSGEVKLGILKLKRDP